MVGMFVSGVTIGNVCDMFGRKFATIISITLSALANFGGGFSQNYYVYVFARFLAGVGEINFIY